MKLLSIIITSWNTADITFKCVQTIKKWLPKDQVEIIVVDNHSTDNTSDLLKPEKITLINNPKNFGFAKANNIGEKQARGKYLLFLNSDVELIDGSLLSMINYLKNHPQIAIIGPKMLNPDLSPQPSVFPPQTFINALKEFWFHLPHSYLKYLPSSSRPTLVFAVSGGALLISHKIFKQLNRWNEKYFFYFEDLDLCRQAHRFGFDVCYYPIAKVIHRHGASGQKLTTPSNQWRRLIDGSQKYHGLFNHYLINSIIWISQKVNSLFSPKS